MADEQQNKVELNLKYLEIFKWIIGGCVAFVGWYVGQVIAPMSNDVQELKNELKPLSYIVKQIETDRDYCKQSLNKLDDNLTQHERKTSEAYYTKQEAYREIRRIEEMIRDMK